MTLILKVKVTKQTFLALSINTHIPNLNGLSKSLFKLSGPKEISAAAMAAA